MNIAHIEKSSLIYGPGTRFVIWTQGCSIRCKGCWNKEMWSFKRKNEISAKELVKKIEKNSRFIEGVTILGGEPFDQYDELLELVKQIKKKNLTIMLYTGYTLKELASTHKNEILEFTDILITGRFIEEKKTMTGGWIGSSNQKIHFLTPAYSPKNIPPRNETEISFDDETGQILIYGYETEEIANILNTD